MIPIDRVLERLDMVKSAGAQAWTARCPAHDDGSPSLSVGIGDEGRVLLHCHAGCTFAEVLSALGLEVGDAFARDGGLSAEQRLRMAEIKIEQIERKQKEHEERLSAIEKLQRSQVHLLYHRALTADKRSLWYNEGIYDEAIDKFLLGWASRCPTASFSQSVTMPVFDKNNDLVNIRHRLLTPGDNGKYRPQAGNLGTCLYNAPILNSSHDRLLILEGEKKTIVFDQFGYAAVGIMGKSVWQREWSGWMEAGRIIVCLDPDAHDKAVRLAGILCQAGHADVRVASFPVKPDDLIVRVGAGGRDIDAILAQARPVHQTEKKGRKP